MEEKTKGLSDAAIHNYLAEVRKWTRRPTDYGPETEDIIRRILNGDIQPPYGQIEGDPGGDGTGTGAEPASIRAADGGSELTPAEKRRDALNNYDLAIETIRHKRDK